MIVNGMKRCNNCKVEKPATLEYFKKGNKSVPGHKRADEFVYTCRECSTKISKLKRAKKYCVLTYNDPELEELSKINYKKVFNKVKHARNKRRGKSRGYYLKNKERILEQRKEYYQKNKEKVSQKNKKHWIENKEMLSKKNAKYREENRERLLEYSRRYQRHAVDNLTDVYIRLLLANHYGLKASQVTPEIIEVYRKQLILYREVKNNDYESRQGTN